MPLTGDSLRGYLVFTTLKPWLLKEVYMRFRHAVQMEISRHLFIAQLQAFHKS